MNVHVINLSQNITADSLEILIAPQGQVISAFVAEKGSTQKHAIIQMGSEAEAKAAMMRLNGSIIDGKIVRAFLEEKV